MFLVLTVITGHSAHSLGCQLGAKLQVWQLTGRAQIRNSERSNPTNALLGNPLKRCEELVAPMLSQHITREHPDLSFTEPCTWDSPQQGHQAVVCHGRNLGIAYVLNVKDRAERVTSWTRWLYMAGQANLVSVIPFIVAFLTKYR